MGVVFASKGFFANEAHKAPIGARTIPDCRIDYFALLCG